MTGRALRWGRNKMAQSDKILRGRVLWFHAEPSGSDDTDAYSFFEDGAILIRDGKIVQSGAFDHIRQQSAQAPVTDHRPNLLLPGFIDTHLHFPQAQIIASWGEQLLEWLQNYTFPAECEFSEPQHAQTVATRFYDELIAHGTTTAVAFCTSHPASVDAYFAEAARRNMCMIGGKTMMDRGAPDALCDTAQRGYDESKMLIEKWHGKGRALYAVTPRFAITSTPEQLDAAGALCAENPSCYMQTHLSENHDEIAYTRELYPDASSYLGVYETYGLLGRNSLFGHSIHLSETERNLMADTGSVPVFCPTSNLFLGSGLYDRAAMDSRGIRSAIATDIGAGTSYSMLKTLDEGYKILQLQGQKLHPFAAFYWITRGNAVALNLVENLGTLDAGSDADIVVLNSRATSAMSLRMDRAESLMEELFVLQTLGDDRAIAQTYVAGQARKNDPS